MGTGIGKNCDICGEQLNYDIGFNENETRCDECIKKINKFLDKAKHLNTKGAEESER